MGAVSEDVKSVIEIGGEECSHIDFPYDGIWSLDNGADWFRNKK